MSKKTIVFTFGRFQPPTTGHGKLFNAVISHAKSVGGEHRIYTSQSFDGGRPRAAVKNPLRYEDKIRFLKQMFPQANIVKSGAGIDTFMDVLYDLEKRGYKKIHMIVGEDRVEGIQNTVDKYLNTGGENALNLEEFKVVSAGHRDPEATGVEGMSASKLRAAVAANDFKLFKTGMPTGFSGARELFDAIAKGLEKPMKKSKKTINEKAPPDEKAERMISKAKDSFQDRYGDNADSYLYGVAWKQYNKRHGIKTKTRLGEPITEGVLNEGKKIVQRYESGRVKLTRYQRICLKAYQASLRMLDINDLTKDERLRYEQMVAMSLGACKEAGMGREHGIKEERELGESVMDLIEKRKSYEQWQASLMLRQGASGKEVKDTIGRKRTPEGKSGNALFRKALLDAEVPTILHGRSSDYTDEPLPPRIQKHNASRGVPTTLARKAAQANKPVKEEIELDEAGQAKLYRMRKSHGRALRRGDTEKQTAMGNATYDKQTKEDEKDVKRTGSVFNMRVKRMAGNRKLLGISDSFEVQNGVELDEDTVMEGGVKSVIEDFIYDLPKEAIEELKVIMKEKYGSSRTNKLIKIRGKYKLPTQVMGYPTVQLINDYFNTYFGAVNEEIEQIDELSPALLGRYIKKAGSSASSALYRAGQMRGGARRPPFPSVPEWFREIQPGENDLYKKVIKREKGIGKAVDRLLSPVIEEERELDEASDDTDIDMTQADFQKMIRSAYNKAYDLCKQGKDISKYKATITAQIESTEIREGILDDLIKNVKDMFKGGSSDGPRYVMTVREAKKMIATATQRGCDEGKKASKKRNLRTESAELSEASNTIPDSAIVVTQNLQKKTITFTWYDGNTEKWIEREVPQDEAPGFYTRAGTAMKTRKTDKYGNLLKAPLPDSTAKFEKLAKANEAIAIDLIALFSKKPMGTAITIYGTKPHKKDEYELAIVKRIYQGEEAFTVKSSGRFVELRKSSTGLQIVDIKTNRIVLDKGNDATW